MWDEAILRRIIFFIAALVAFLLDGIIRLALIDRLIDFLALL